MYHIINFIIICMSKIYKSGSLQKGGVRVSVVQVVLHGDCNSHSTVCMYVVEVGVAD